MAINVTVWYNGGFLPELILLILCYYHRGTRLSAMKRFCLCSLCSHISPRYLGSAQVVYMRSFISLNCLDATCEYPAQKPHRLPFGVCCGETRGMARRVGVVSFHLDEPCPIKYSNHLLVQGTGAGTFFFPCLADHSCQDRPSYCCLAEPDEHGIAYHTSIILGSRLALYQTLFSKCLSLRCANACMRQASAFVLDSLYSLPCACLHPTYVFVSFFLKRGGLFFLRFFVLSCF